MDPLPPDPYSALGVPKDATSATIKSTYRKLVLKCHPDKVTDESLKQQKQEEFHKIQQAYEIIGDDEKRSQYDAQVKLEALRKEKASRSGGAEVKTARYETRTAAPAGATFSAKGPARYEERKAPRSYDEDRFYGERASRKYDTYEAQPKHSSSSRSPRKEEPKVSSKTDRTRSDQRRTRDRDERRDRSDKGKYTYVQDDDSSSNDDKARYEAEYKRRSRDEADRALAAEERRKAEERRSYEASKERRYHSGDDRDDRLPDRSRKLSSQESDAVRHIHKSRLEAEVRPSVARTSSSRDVNSYERSSRRPEPPRRSSARPKDKGIPEIVEWSEPEAKVPSFKHSSSSPADLHVPPSRGVPQRSYTESSSSRDHRRSDRSPPAAVRRSETMPSVPRSRKDATPSRPSGLRSAESASPYHEQPELSYATVPPPQASSKSTYYHYPTSGGAARLASDDVGVANGHRTVLREPERHRARSPSPLSRPPMGANRRTESYQPAAPAPPRATSATMPPPLSRSSTYNPAPAAYLDERGRSGRLYGELPKRENTRRAYSPAEVTTSKRYGPEDVRWVGRGGDERAYPKPTLGRTATYVY